MGILRNEPVYRIASGGTAGLTEILLFHPLDVIKTRLQSQTPGSPDAYKENGQSKRPRVIATCERMLNLNLINTWSEEKNLNFNPYP